MNNQAFSKIWILLIVVVLIAGGFFAWQYFGASEDKIRTLEEKALEDVVEEGKLVTVLTPNGGEIWRVGETYTITWTNHNVENVIITLLQGSSVSYLIGPREGFDASLGKFDWKINSNALYVKRSDLRVVLYDAEACGYVGPDIGGECRKDGLIHSDGSDRSFSIVE